MLQYGLSSVIPQKVLKFFKRHVFSTRFECTFHIFSTRFECTFHIFYTRSECVFCIKIFYQRITFCIGAFINDHDSGNFIFPTRFECVFKSFPPVSSVVYFPSLKSAPTVGCSDFIFSKYFSVFTFFKTSKNRPKFQINGKIRV